MPSLFADDANLFSFSRYLVAADMAQEDLKRFEEWMGVNRLNLNVNVLTFISPMLRYKQPYLQHPPLNSPTSKLNSPLLNLPSFWVFHSLALSTETSTSKWSAKK
eukprot:Pompholyxophrys_punicea_v1_NODE_255_length_2515_cov_15.886133.p1 type:complete len:105 gc:universal NODE_255_length_2515_cov_15.886133:1821-2135(+)